MRLECDAQPNPEETWNLADEATRVAGLPVRGGCNKWYRDAET